jgi:hypothetical protein
MNSDLRFVMAAVSIFILSILGAYIEIDIAHNAMIAEFPAVSAEVLDVRCSDECVIYIVRYTTPDGVSHTTNVSFLDSGTSIGDTVTVHYVPDQPNHAYSGNVAPGAAFTLVIANAASILIALGFIWGIRRLASWARSRLVLVEKRKRGE